MGRSYPVPKVVFRTQVSSAPPGVGEGVAEGGIGGEDAQTQGGGREAFPRSKLAGVESGCGATVEDPGAEGIFENAGGGFAQEAGRRRCSGTWGRAGGSFRNHWERVFGKRRGVSGSMGKEQRRLRGDLIEVHKRDMDRVDKEQLFPLVEGSVTRGTQVQGEGQEV